MSEGIDEGVAMTGERQGRATHNSRTALVIMALASLGGILYGYDLGIISGALLFINQDLSLSPSDSSLIVAAVLGGGAVATLFSGPFADRFGRRFSLNLSAVIFIIGVVIVVFSTSFAAVLIGRIVQGIGIGIITIVVPLYLVETMPPALRGRGVTLFQLCLTFGILLGYLIGYALHASGDWQMMFATMLVPAVAFLIGGLFVLPRSPRWLYRRGRIEEARQVLARTQAATDSDRALAELKAADEEEKKHGSGDWGLLFQPGFRKAFFIALAVGILNQLTGINTLLQYNTVILHDSGLQSAAGAILGSVGVGIANFVITIIALSLIDKVGRRPLLIVGTAGALVALAFIGIVHLLVPPSVFTGYATLAGFIVFVIFYAVGPGVVVWLAISEVLPLAIRAKGMAVALFANSLVSAGLAAVFMTLVESIGYGGMFLLLAFFVLLYLLVAIFPLPETRGRTLEEIEKMFFAGVRR
jgi:sugar porter (SP) family MFS transporter